ncbi:MAG: hypothetical protein RI911_150 [Candidatus Parcubacteria bacterium]|jgi:hypothetical protein
MNTFIFWLFDGPRETKFFAWYRRFFGIEEWETQTTVKWVIGAALLSYYTTFSTWIGSPSMTINGFLQGRATCWPYFQNCTDYYFLYSLPYGYSQTTFYMCLFGILILCVYLFYKKEWILLHMFMLVPFIWHVLGNLVLTHQNAGNFDYYLIAFASILLFAHHKEYFLKVALVSFYFLSTATKIHDAWVLGTYFSALSTGLPFFPDWSLPLVTNQLIFMEMVGAWFLLSKRPWLQRSVAAYFIFFHLYSGILVEYRYPSTVLPTLIILFALFYRYQEPPFNKKAVIGWVLVGIWYVAQVVPFLIEGDQKYTQEANKFGMYMFESNHQCISTATYRTTDGATFSVVRKNDSSRNRCNPFDYLQGIQHRCKHGFPQVETARWTFDHSINGRPFYRQVDEQDACTLTYNAWSHNEWIRLQHEAEVVGYPYENWFY